MKRGRNDLKQAAPEKEECQSIAEIVSLRDPDQIEIMNAKGVVRSLALDMGEIPLDLLIEFLIRLPAKSLVSSKCVSKQWLSLISSRYFCNRLFTVTRQEQPHLYMCLVDESGQRALLSISSDNICYVVDPDLGIPGMGGFFLNVVGGLMCFSVRKKASIYNPTTRQLLTLPAIKSDMRAEQGQSKDTRYYIGHDPVNDQYKLVCTIAISSAFFVDVKSEHWVFVLEAGGSWKKLVPQESYHPHAPSTIGHFINGSVVHYMAWLDIDTCAVVSFDVRSEELTTILVPPEAGDVGLPAFEMKAGVIEYGGKIAVFDYTHLMDKFLVDLWVLKDAGKKKWSKKRRFLQPCQRHLVQDTELIAKGTTQDGKVVLAPVKACSQFYILRYDLQNNDLRKVEIKGIPPHLWFEDKGCYFDLKFMDESDHVIYLET